MKNFATEEQVVILQKQIIETRGQLIAMGAAMRALILAHPDRDSALSTVTSELLRWEAFGLNSEAPDLVLKGFEKAKGVILPTDGDLDRYSRKPHQE